MKIQNLAIIFIIIILPISLVLASYTKGRVQTISLQSNYDSKLNDATHDAIKAYQLNSFSSDTSDYTNSKIRDIKASINTFFNSLSTNFNTLGYTKDTLQNYVPAIVYTMYDGYYIYSPFTNTWNTVDENNNPRSDDVAEESREQITPDEQHKQHTYSDNEKLYGLKPYVYYSCRYKTDGGIDVVITYSLDNYIQIQGKVRDNTTGEIIPISKYGYLLSNVQETGNEVKYKGLTIVAENLLSEKVYVNGEIKGPLKYKKENGTKYYIDDNDGTVFSVLNGRKIVQQNKPLNNDDNAVQYYRKALELKTFMENYGLTELTTNDIVDIDTGKWYSDQGKESPYYSINEKIFDFDNVDGIESETSNFNTHRIDVIKNSIERNLSIAISNFNHYSNVTTDFQMPKLKDTDWDKIMSNISVISFFQGANIGGKVYNGYSVITNTKNEDVVMEDSIYIKKSDGTIHDITEDGLSDDDLTAVGVYNINTEIRAGDGEITGGSAYYMPVEGTLSYDSIITKNNISSDFKGNLGEYVDSLQDTTLKQKYYTALGRERNAIYRQKLEF